MNLRIARPEGLVATLYRLLGTSGTILLLEQGWSVVQVEEGLFYRRIDRVEVGGPYATLGELVRDAGHQRHSVWSEGAPPRELIWDAVEWGGAFFTVHTARLDAPTRHATLAEAITAGREVESA